ncbi:molybdenum cofactor guanylyltransferase [Salibacteraceae bacterium]|nr:molybdenum cofactor guanylyltransferase [Salibacteraceae bacterium]
MTSKLPIVLLCGGQSKRMGQPKHLLMVNELPIWKLLKSRYESAGYEVFISCNHSQVEDFENSKIIVDSIYCIGPLGGLISVMMALKARHFFILSCDTPLVSVKTLEIISTEMDDEKIAVCARNVASGFSEPTIALWNRTYLTQLKKSADTGNYSLTKVLKSHSFLAIDIPQGELKNANTIDDWNDVLKYLELEI